MEDLGNYAVAITSLLVFVLITLVQSALVGAGKASADLVPGSEPDMDYDNRLYRLNRAHQNAVEVMPAAAIALFSCVLLGVSAWWVNLLMGIFLVTRVIYLGIYAQNMGKPTQGLRTMVFVAGWATLVVLCCMAIWTLF